MYAAVAADELQDPFDSDRRVLLAGRKRSHIFEQLRTPSDSDYSYKGIELPSLTTKTFSTIPERQNLSKQRRFWQDTKDELRTFEWRKWCWRFLCLVLPPVTILALLLVTIWICIPGILFKSTDVCRPDGSFYYGLGTYSPWHTSSLFQIDVGFGSFTFANAKLIDFWWDLLVGRGGQLVMAYLAYKACTKALIRHLELHDVPIETFEAIAIQDHSMTGLVKLVKTVTANRDARSMVSMVWFIIASGYVLLFPSFVSAMSGYSAQVTSYLRVTDGSLVPWKDFDQVRYILHDGARLGSPFYDNYAVTVPEPSYGWTSGASDWGDCSNDWTYDYDSTYNQVLKAGARPQCKLLYNTAMYANQSGYLGLNKSSSVFNNSGNLIDLKAPTLNITAYFASGYKASDGSTPNKGDPYYATGFYWKNPETGNFTFGDAYNPTVTKDNETFSGSDLETRGLCQQTVVQYKWGFSFVLLFSLLVCQVVWSIGVYTTYLDSWLHSRLDTTGRHLGLQRATLDLAAAMNPFVPKDENESGSNAKIKTLVANSSITYAHLVSDSLLSSRGARLKDKWRAFKFKNIIKSDKYWFALFVVAFLMVMLSIYPLPYLPPFIANIVLLVGLAMVLYAGPASKARWLIALIAFAAFGILTGLAYSRALIGIWYFNPLYLGFGFA